MTVNLNLWVTINNTMKTTHPAKIRTNKENKARCSIVDWENVKQKK